MELKLKIQYQELFDLIKQLPYLELTQLKRDIQSLGVDNYPKPKIPISSLRGKISKQSDTAINNQLNALRDEWNDTF